jgi:hypothetical protein
MVAICYSTLGDARIVRTCRGIQLNMVELDRIGYVRIP